MKKGSIKPVRCAIYTRVSTDYGLEQGRSRDEVLGPLLCRMPTGRSWSLPNSPQFAGIFAGSNGRLAVSAAG